VVANDRGAVVGSPTTPIELGRIEEGLNLYVP
jgi:translation initiation factor 6 (eIF-6)